MPGDPNRIQAVFSLAVEATDAAARAQVLNRECGDDAELRQRVEALLAAHDASGGFLDRPPVSPLSTVDEPRRIEGPGGRIGPYKLLQQIGEGGMGVVYLAEQTEPVQRKVALKVIKPGMDTHQVVARFEAERQALALMDHPNIARVLDAGATDSGRPYFVMELVKGLSITKYCDQEHLTPQERLQLFVPICHAVQHAHQKGIIHRDLKPSNILIALYDGVPVPKVIDFGVAKATGTKLTERTLFTEVGHAIGTWEYMAPEQAELNNLDIDTRADIYALGATLYELLAGSPPFTAKQLRKAAFDERLRLIREVEPPKPSTRLSSSDELPTLAAKRKLEPANLSRLVRGDLDWIVMKCLEKERARRYETANQLGEELRRFLCDEPVQARPPSAGYRAKKFLKRNKGTAIAAALVALALVTGIIGTSIGLVMAAQSLSKAEQQTRQRALAQVNALRDAAPGAVPAILAELEANRETVLPQLRERYAQEKERPKRMRLALALVSVEPAALRDDLAAWMLQMDDPAEVMLIRDALAPHKVDLVDRLWGAVEKPDKDHESKRLPAAAALATYDAQSARWDQARGKVVEDLVAVNPLFLGPWSEAFRPVRLRLLPPLSEIFRDQRPERIAERKLATSLLADYAADQPQVLADLLMDADEKQFAAIFLKFKEQSERGLPILSAEIDKKPVIVKDKIVLEKKGVIAKDVAKVMTQQGELPGKRYEFPLQAGKLYRMTMDSNDLDSFLVLHDKAGKELASDDDSGGGLNSLLFYAPSSDGTYTVIAAALQNQKKSKNTGSFVLTITEIVSDDAGKEKLAKRQANAAVALVKMNQPEKAWQLLRRRQEPDDPRARSYLIHRFGPLGADAEALVKRLDEEPDVTIRRALILSLGEFEDKAWTADDRNRVTENLQEIYRTAADPGLHAASEWLLRHWKHDEWLKQENDKWAEDKDQREKKIDTIKQMMAKDKEKTPQWYVNGQGHTMVAIPGPVEFIMGSPPTEAGRADYERQHKKRIGRTFAIASKSVTMEQYQKFSKGYNVGETKYHRMADLPVVFSSWYMAAAYCNWLSKEAGIDEKEWCYEIKEQVTTLRENYLSLSGYRLPTEAEMEYSTRAGAVTSRYFGETEELLAKYAWYAKNSKEQPWPVGSLKPNDLGFFDVQGNAWTWCQESYKDYPTGKGEEAYEDREDGSDILPMEYRVMRGESFIHQSSNARSAYRRSYAPSIRYNDVGFRVARTLPLDGISTLPPDPRTKPVATTLLEKKESLTDKDSGWMPTNPKGDPLLKLVSGNPHKVYTLHLTKGDKLVIRLKSKDKKFDPVVALEDSKKNIIAYNDDEDSANNILDSRLVVTIPEDGEYRIIATCSQEDIRNKYGDFHLTVEKTK